MKTRQQKDKKKQQKQQKPKNYAHSFENNWFQSKENH